jgi:hypothetical protein
VVLDVADLLDDDAGEDDVDDVLLPQPATPTTNAVAAMPTTITEVFMVAHGNPLLGVRRANAALCESTVRLLLWWWLHSGCHIGALAGMNSPVLSD